MTRLGHSYGGYLRTMQISSAELFIFVEGRQSDPYFYARICETVHGLGSRYAICLAEELPGGTGGKQALLNFYEYLRKRKALLSSLAGQRTASVFFLDKDIDDMQHRKKAHNMWSTRSTTMSKTTFSCMAT